MAGKSKQYSRNGIRLLENLKLTRSVRWSLDVDPMEML